MMTKVIGGILRVVKGKERGKRIARSSHMMMIMMILPRKVIIILNHLLRLVKELCEGKESCQITPSNILAQHSKCQKVGW